jgi:ATP adenylyltransferase
MEYLHAPWRIQYIRQAVKDEAEGCFLCESPAAGDDEKTLILYRGLFNFVVMNNYPYNSGHLMIAPCRHLAQLSLLSEEERHEHIDLVSRCTDILRDVFHPDGFNIGLNLGRVAGAGVDKHLHTHIVPRWNGDTNFMPVLADTKVINQAVEETYKQLKPSFEKMRRQ